jgi:hypothetical protein
MVRLQFVVVSRARRRFKILLRVFRAKWATGRRKTPTSGRFRYFKALLSVIFFQKPENAGFSGVFASLEPIKARLGSI